MNVKDVQDLSNRLKENIKLVIKGKDEIIEKVILSLLCSGHILLEDIPGTGKTTLAKALAKSIDCNFKRVQFTPDLLPSDLTGIHYYNQKSGEFIFRPGSVFTNVLLGDEINRATPRTQSSLLECMEERQVSIDGETHLLENPFLVIATQNPLEIQGTFPLPEAQLDRFFMKLSLGYPDAEHEFSMLTDFKEKNPLDDLHMVVSKEEIIQSQQVIRQVSVGDAVKEYLLQIVNATRAHDKIRLGASPRASLALLKAAQAWAAMMGREYVLPDDIKAVTEDVLSHRMICKGHSMMNSSEIAREGLRQILIQIPVPIEAEKLNMTDAANE